MTIRRDPFEMMDRMFEQMRRSMQDEWMDETRPAFASPEGSYDDERGLRRAGGFDGDANLRTERTDEGYLVMADLPGFRKEDITVRFEDGILSITADSEATEEDEFSVTRRNRRVYDELRMPGTVREDDISATYRNGVLEVTLPTEGDVTDGGHVIDVE